MSYIDLSAKSDKVALKSIKVIWSESTRIDDGLVFNTWEDFDRKLLDASFAAPKTGAYDKTKFKVTWEDGTEYIGRYDLHHPEYGQENPNGFCDLRDHMGRNQTKEAREKYLT